MGRARSTSSLSPRPRLETGPAQRRQSHISADSGALQLSQTHLGSAQRFSARPQPPPGIPAQPQHLRTAPLSCRGKWHPTPARAGLGYSGCHAACPAGCMWGKLRGTGPRTGHVNPTPPRSQEASGPLYTSCALDLCQAWGSLVSLFCFYRFSA